MELRGLYGDYNSLMKLWNDWQAVENHNCPDEEFTTCEVCERSWQARNKLAGQLNCVMELLERYHNLLEELVKGVIQEVPFPREEHLQAAMIGGLNALNRDGRKMTQ